MDTKSTKMTANKTKKAAIVAEIVEKVGKSKAMVFTNYQGLTHQQLEGFKREIKKADAQFVVAKNTLLRRALSEQKFDTKDQELAGQTGALFLYGDVVTPLKALAKMVKDLEKPQISFGLLDGAIMSKEQVLKLSTLPSREQLLGQLVGMLNSPVQRLQNALSGNLQKLVMTLSAIKSQKS